MKKTFILLTLALVACNKDDVLTPDTPDMPANYRPMTSESSKYFDRVYEYTPAPGQFINETATGGFDGTETTAERACTYASDRMRADKFVSLGAFGGYIVVGFDHSIDNSGGYDFAVKGNAFDTSNEPGIVWVMQDENGNSLPDDTWYELRASESNVPTTKYNYSVTYYRPSTPQQPVKWTDSEGQSGQVNYLIAFHKQDYYYPAWIGADSYTLTGTRIEARNVKNPESGEWHNLPYDWGYADNTGSDELSEEYGLSGQWVGFKISNAVDSSGRPVKLDFIDFVKVQQAVQAQSGPIGENSCEVFNFADI